MALTHLTQAPEEEQNLEEEAQVEVRNTKEGFYQGGAPRSGEKKGAGGDKGQVPGASQRGVAMPSRWAGMRAASRQASTMPMSCSSANPRAAVAT